jgi:two-component system, OmpR family, heavy metal sensor histidine kinase CusS
MKSRSFRAQIVLWSVLVSGTVLFTFGMVSWWSLQRDRVRALDESISTFGFRHATRASANAEIRKMELSMVENFGEERAATRFFAFLTNEDEVLHLSPGWPALIDPLGFEPSPVLLDPQPSLPEPPPREDRGEPGRRSRLVYTPLFFTVDHKGETFRIGVFANSEVRLLVGADLSEFSGEVDALRRAFLLALPGALLLVGSGAWWIARRALRSVEALGEDMQQVSARSLGTRLEPGRADQEFTVIVAQYNAMLERLERSFHQATRFSADASHELKTPIAVMQGTLERALLESGDDSGAQAIYSDLLELIDHQKAILEGLLLLSRADSGQLRLSTEAVDLSLKLNLWLEDAGYLAEDREITIRSEIAPDLWVRGDSCLLQQVAHNLFSNAARHNVDGGEIFCRLYLQGDSLILEISNTGPEISESEREKVFARFQRGSAAQGNGSGLGLSLVREIVTAHGGTINLQSEEERTVFRVSLPKIPPV